MLEFVMGVVAGLTVAMIVCGLTRAKRESAESKPETSKEEASDLKRTDGEFCMEWLGLQSAVYMNLMENKTGRRDKTIDKIIYVERITGKSISELYKDEYGQIFLRLIFSEDNGSSRCKGINDKPKEE